MQDFFQPQGEQVTHVTANTETLLRELTSTQDLSLVTAQKLQEQEAALKYMKSQFEQHNREMRIEQSEWFEQMEQRLHFSQLRYVDPLIAPVRLSTPP